MGTTTKKIEQARTLVEAEMVETQEGEKEGSGKATPDNPDGRGRYRRQLERFATLKDEEKHQTLKETWKEVAMGAALRAKSFVATCAPKDFTNLYRIIMSGAIAIDKAYPPRDQQRDLAHTALVVNMFGTLGQRAVNIVMPPLPERQERKDVIPCHELDPSQPPKLDSPSPTGSLLPQTMESLITVEPSTLSP